jgi:hypothetical protein
VGIVLPDRLDGPAISLAIALMAIPVNCFVLLSPVVGVLMGWPTLGKSLSVLSGRWSRRGGWHLDRHHGDLTRQPARSDVERIRLHQ